MIDLVLGAVVFGGFMLAWWHERQNEIVTVIFIDDEVLARMTASMKRIEPVMRSFGVASRDAAKAFEKFGKAWSVSMEREAGKW